jgi:hypothetical protein
MSRLKEEWYSKRIKQNEIIKTHLIGLIEKYQNSTFPWTKKELSYLNYEDLLEIAIATANKNVSITLGSGSDFTNGRDAKFSIVRSYSYGKSYAAGITKCDTKDHILACVYEGIQEKFYYFSFPSMMSEHTIPFDKVTGEPKTKNPMWDYCYTDFKKMANS